MERPVFKPHLQINVIPGEGVLALSEDNVFAMHGRVYELLAPLLDGSRDEDALVDALASEVDGATVYYALAMLEKEGYLAEFAPDISPETAAFWHGLGVVPRTALDALKSTRVRVRSLGGVDVGPLRLALTDLGAALVEYETTDFDIVAVDDYLRPELTDINAENLQNVRPWLLVKPSGHEIWIGPLFVPGKTGCHRCLAVRLERHRAAHRFAAGKNGEPPARQSFSPAADVAGRLAAVESVKFIAGASEGLEGKVLSLDLRNGTPASHDLLRHPFCTSCGEREKSEALSVKLVNRQATYIQDGGHRVVEPVDTIRKYERLVSPVTGVVKSLMPIQSDNGLVNVYVAGHNPAFKMDNLDFLKKSLRNASAGKGMSDAQAKASALCEAIERYSGERTGGEITMCASFQEMRKRYGPDAIHPNDVMRYSDRQLAEKEGWNAKKSKFNRVVDPLDETACIDWTPVWSLTHKRHKYLPTQLLYYQSKAGPDCDVFYSMGCSNGNASGNNLEEAVLQGFFELVERDAVALWWYNRLSKPAVDVESFGEPYLIELIDYYQKQGREAWALDITSDLGVPAFTAVSRFVDQPEERIMFGLGCHLDPRIALVRAFAEMNQMFGLANGGENRELNIEDNETLSWLKAATLENQPYMAPDETVVLKRRQDFTDLSSGDLLEDINLCQSIVEERGMEMLVLDQTRQDVKMPVAKVIVPGLRHFWARFAPGRLYDVPIKMGWLDKPLKEEELNPIPVFF